MRLNNSNYYKQPYQLLGFKLENCLYYEYLSEQRILLYGST